MRVRCPDCSEMIAVPEAAQPGDLLECPNCAGQALRLRQDSETWAATLASRVSCPHCEDAVTLPEDVQAGDTIECCGRQYRLSFEYGAFAPEEP